MKMIKCINCCFFVVMIAFDNHTGKMCTFPSLFSFLAHYYMFIGRNWEMSWCSRLRPTWNVFIWILIAQFEYGNWKLKINDYINKIELGIIGFIPLWCIDFKGRTKKWKRWLYVSHSLLSRGQSTDRTRARSPNPKSIWQWQWNLSNLIIQVDWNRLVYFSLLMLPFFGVLIILRRLTVLLLMTKHTFTNKA